MKKQLKKLGLDSYKTVADESQLPSQAKLPLLLDKDVGSDTTSSPASNVLKPGSTTSFSPGQELREDIFLGVSQITAPHESIMEFSSQLCDRPHVSVVDDLNMASKLGSLAWSRSMPMIDSSIFEPSFKAPIQGSRDNSISYIAYENGMFRSESSDYSPMLKLLQGNLCSDALICHSSYNNDAVQQPFVPMGLSRASNFVTNLSFTTAQSALNTEKFGELSSLINLNASTCRPGSYMASIFSDEATSTEDITHEADSVKWSDQLLAFPGGHFGHKPEESRNLECAANLEACSIWSWQMPTSDLGASSIAQLSTDPHYDHL